MKTTNLTNRYGDKNKLVWHSDVLAHLELDPKASDCYRIGLRDGFTWEDNEYYFVDPSGGPFLSIGSEVDGKEINRIYRQDNVIYLEFNNGNDTKKING